METTVQRGNECHSCDVHTVQLVSSAIEYRLPILYTLYIPISWPSGEIRKCGHKNAVTIQKTHLKHGDRMLRPGARGEVRRLYALRSFTKPHRTAV